MRVTRGHTELVSSTSLHTNIMWDTEAGGGGTIYFILYIITGTVLETDFIPRPGDTISLYFYPFIVSPYKYLPPLGNQ